MYHYGLGFGFFPLFPILWPLFWIFVIIFIFGGFRRYHHWHDHGHSRDRDSQKSAEDILAERFARGEIEEEEYTKRLDILKKHTRNNK